MWVSMAVNQICITRAIFNEINFILLVWHNSKENTNWILGKEWKSVDLFEKESNKALFSGTLCTMLKNVQLAQNGLPGYLHILIHLFKVNCDPCCNLLPKQV